MSLNTTTIMNNIWSAVQAPFLRRWRSGAQIDQIDSTVGNGYDFFWKDQNNANDLPAIGWDTDGQFRVGGAFKNPTRSSTKIHIFPNGSQASQTIFTNCTPTQLVITGISEVHTTAGTASGAVTAIITHETAVGGVQQAMGTGVSVMSNTFNLKGTAETVQNATLAQNFTVQSRNNSTTVQNPLAGVVVLQPGDTLSIKYTGTLTTLAGLTITLYFWPGSKYQFSSFQANAAGTAATTSLLISMRPRTLLYGAAIWGVAESTAATLTLDVTKDATTTAPGGGTSMLASTINLKGAANTYKQMTLSATAANLATISTDSVAVKISASTTELAGLCVTLAFDGKQDEVQVDYNAFNSTAGTSEEFWIADRDYLMLDFASKITTQSTSNVVKLTIDTGTNAPSGGTAMQTTGFATSTQTVNAATFPGTDFTAPGYARFLRAGDRLGLLNSGTTGALAGLQVSVRLQPM